MEILVFTSFIVACSLLQQALNLSCRVGTQRERKSNRHRTQESIFRIWHADWQIQQSCLHANMTRPFPIKARVRSATTLYQE